MFHGCSVPATSGGLFSVDKQWFMEVGSYDDDMNVWGCENIGIFSIMYSQLFHVITITYLSFACCSKVCEVESVVQYSHKVSLYAALTNIFFY